MINALFSDDAVPLSLLRERAFNLRWAQQPPDVIPLTAADPDFPVATAIQEQIIRYVRDGVLSYGPSEGLPQFREAVAEWMRSTRQMECPSEAVFATDSAAAAIAVSMRVCCVRSLLRRLRKTSRYNVLSATSRSVRMLSAKMR